MQGTNKNCKKINQITNLVQNKQAKEVEACISGIISSLVFILSVRQKQCSVVAGWFLQFSGGLRASSREQIKNLILLFSTLEH